MAGRTHLRLALTLCLLVAPWTVGRAEQPPIRVYTAAHGLAADNVFRVRADSRGFLWFCTLDGLSRFDGYAFVSYTTRDGLPDRRLSDVCETRDGSVWVATASGLCRFGQAGGPLFAVESLGEDPKANQINVLLGTRDGALWVGTGAGLFRLEPRDGRWSASRVEIGAPCIVTTLAEDRWAGVWVGVSGELRFVRPDGRVETHPLPGLLVGQFPDRVYEDASGRLWVGTRLGIWCSTPRASADAAVAFARIGADVVRGWGNAFLQSRDGTMWLATTEGLWRETAANASGFERRAAVQAACGLSVADLVEDRDGNLWLATECGVLRVDRHGFTGYTKADGLATLHVNSIFETKAGDLVVTTNQNARRVHRLGGGGFTSIVPNLPSTYDGWGWGQTVIQDREGVWWVPSGNGLYRYPRSDLPEQALGSRPEPVYTGREVFRVFEDSKGDVWLVTTNWPGLLRWERATGRVVDLTAETGVGQSAEYTAFAETRDGALWIGTGSSGLLRYRDGRFERFHREGGVPEGWMRALHVDDAGRLWVASSRGGVGRIDDPTAAEPRFAVYTMAEGLSSDNVWSVVSDRWQRVYVGTPRGIDRIDPATGRITHYTQADGLPRNQVQAAFRDRSGSLWFGSVMGLVRFDPEPEREREPPRTLVTGLRIAGVARPVSALGETALAALDLGPGEGNVSVDFLGLGSSLGEELRYQYKLVGAGEDWSAPGPERTVTFASLAPGSYRFLVRAVDTGGLASPEPATIAFTVAAPVWQRWWVVALAAAIVGAAAYGAHRSRVRHVLEIERVRTHIATDLHDDIGANLTKIAALSEIANYRLGGDESLASIADISRESVAAMSDIVWAVDPGRGGFRDLTRRMRRIAEEAFVPRGIRTRFAAPEVDDVRVGDEVRRHVYLVFKEAINNAVRHSDCSSVDVSLEVDRHRLVLKVEDDGHGFDPSDEVDGNGLANMRKRAAAIGASLDVRSEAGLGTSVTLTVPLREGRFRRSGPPELGGDGPGRGVG